MDIAACAWLLLLVCSGGCLCFILWAALCKAFYSINGEFGNELAVRQFGQHAFHVVLGDYSTKLVYEEIFLKKVYFNHQISLDQHGPLVLDVGGNIGFFSAFVAEHYKGSRIHVFEPLPLLVKAISLNLATHGCVVFHAHDGKTLLNDAPLETRVVVHQTALGDEETELSLTYQPRMLAGSSLVPEEFLPKGVDKLDFVRAMYLDSIKLGALPTFPARFMCELLGIPLLRIPAFFAFLPWMMFYQIQQRMSGCKQMTMKTPVRKLSNMLKEQGLHGQTIDLLKVDVEGAELKVLLGIDDATWCCINQMVVEVHDGEDGRVDKIIELCKTKGFTKVVKAQEGDLELPKLCKIFLVFATK